MAAHEQEIQDLSERIDADRNRQQMALRDRLADRRKRKLADLRRRQEMEITKEMLMQKKELDEIRVKQVKKKFLLMFDPEITGLSPILGVPDFTSDSLCIVISI